MSAIQVVELSKWFDRVPAVRNLNVEVRRGEFLVLLGPSGCGKTTLLRCIAGLEQPSSGDVYLDETCAFSYRNGIDVPPKQRRIGLVFQNYALYPHLTVFQNVAFGLKIRRVPKDEIRRRVRRALQMVDLQMLADRYPRQLSGGQQQRAAVARTVVSEPRILLFDEPLSNLDPLLRVNVRAGIRRLHSQLGTTSVYVTHDQQEAMILGDRLGVLADGDLVQIGPPREIYDSPATIDVAEFTANPRTNILAGEIHATEDRVLFLPQEDPYCFILLPDECRRFARERIVLHVRPEALQLLPASSADEGRFAVVAVFDESPDTLIVLGLGERLPHIMARRRNGDRERVHRDDVVRVRPLRGNLYEPVTRRLLGSFDSGEAPRNADIGVESTRGTY